MTNEEKQEIITAQLRGRIERMEAEARREGRGEANPDEVKVRMDDESEKSSDWDDWQDPEYIEE